MKLFFLLLSFSVFAHIPSEESILRNNQKEQYAKDTTVFNIKVNFQEKVAPKLPEGNVIGAPVQETTTLEKKIEEEEDEILEEHIVNKETYLKYITKNEQQKIEQILYDGEIIQENIVDFKDFSLTLKEENKNFNQQLYYSIINILTRSDSFYFISLMKKIGIDLKTNKDLIDFEKKALFEKQKDFLALTKNLSEEEIVSNNLKSPLLAETDEDQEKVDELVKSNWLKKSPNINLIKRGNKLYWEIKTSNFSSLIENETRRIESIEFRHEEDSYSINFNKFLLFEGQYDLPQLTLIKQNGNIIFEINILKIFNFDESDDNIARRRSIYSKSIKDNEEKKGQIDRPEFLL